MLQRALIKFDKTVFLRKSCYRNGLIMCIVVHETRRQKKKNGLSINDLLLFTLNLFRSLNNICYLFLDVKGVF